MSGAGRRRRDEPYLLNFIKPQVVRLTFFLTWLGRPLYFILATAFFLVFLLLYSFGSIFLFLLKRLPFFTKFFILLTKTVAILFLLTLTRIARKLKRLSKVGVPRLRIPRIAIPRITILAAALLVVLPLLGLGFSFWFLVIRDLPTPAELVSQPRPLTTKIYDRDGKLLYKIFRNQNRTFIPLSEIPLHVRQATIAIEDAEFYYHPGFSIRGMLRAIGKNLESGELSGGSTITQQLVKNALLTPEKTIERKLKEIVLAILVEMSFPKDKILEMYLNEVAYGGAAYGIEEAAQLYFGKSARNLSLAEGALSAGLPRAPTRYSPFGANPQIAFARQQLVLARMAEEGFITPNQAKEAASQKLSFAPQKTDIKAPHFVMWIRQILVEKYGQRLVEEGGLSVVTSLDLDIQEQAEKIVQEEVGRLAGLRVSNAAALVTRPSTGEVLAMVGSRNYFDSQIDGNFNVTLAARQPGSSIKPVNYSYALSNGFTAASIISDTPITYKIPGTEPYSPRNYDGRFHGRIPLRVALASSYNVPAVKVLASYGVNKMIEQGQKMGITTWNDPSRLGLSLTLGGGEVKMTDMAEVFAVLANYGKKVNLVPILRVTDANGRVLEESGCNIKISSLQVSVSNINVAEAAPVTECGEQVLDPRIAFLLTDILRDNQARSPAFGPNSLLVIPEHPEAAVKTGTTQNLRDNWANGYTKDFVVITWVGNNDNTPMSWVASGVTGATPIWHRIMQYLLEGEPNPSGPEAQRAGGNGWEVPQGLVRVAICPLTGTLPCEGCSVKEEWFLEENQPKTKCELKPVIEELEQETQGQILSAQEKREKILEKLEQRRNR